MGYTHYWSLKQSDTSSMEWSAAIDDCEQIIANSPCDISREHDGVYQLALNGTGDDECETFVIPRVSCEIEFDCCKTARRDYDVVVKACLARLYEAGLSVRSDGPINEWKEGIALAEKALGRPIQLDEKFLSREPRSRSLSKAALDEKASAAIERSEKPGGSYGF